jgi:DNA-binding transcriptional MerR regulator
MTVEKAPDAFRTISEVAEELGVPQHVLRFWESRFREIKPLKRGGGRRYYRPEDIGLLRGIHHLLYGEGYTIRGVQRILRDQGVRFVQTVWQPGAPRPAHPAEPDDVADIAIDADADLPSVQGSEGPRLAPSIIGREAGPQEPGVPLLPRTIAAPTQPVLAAPPARGLEPETLQKLTVALRELGECRELLDAAMGERP